LSTTIGKFLKAKLIETIAKDAVIKQDAKALLAEWEK
jgi:hypothetical protein